ncbi:TerB N-terminal domain-containing protein [Phormidium tenue FACHB-886]|nr:TerB N-terminal domain-containing protein [Phormidium tenue FACHB-886]
MEFKPFWELLSELGIQLPDSAKLQRQNRQDRQKKLADRAEAMRIISLPTGASAGSSFEMIELLEEYLQDIQTNREAEGDRCWVPPGKTVRVAGYKLSGMVYVGESLTAVSHSRAIEPSLIRPSSKVDRKRADLQGQDMAYGYNSRSYTQMQPSSRAGYLEWLSTGRRDPKAFNGYVWLFFYGLERRVFHELLQSNWQADAKKRQELDQIINEVEELKQVYGNAYSFHGAFNYKADEFLSICRILKSPDRLTEINPLTAKPLELQIGLGQKVKQRQPLPADWALAWYSRLSNHSLPTAALRCPDEFRTLFQLRYADRFGEGMKLKIGKALLSTVYQPTSQSFWGRAISVNVGDIPDVSRFSAKLKQIGEVVQQCRSELEPLSRFLARNPEGRNTLSATALLPADLIVSHGGAVIEKLQKWLDKLFPQPHTQVVVISGKEVLKQWAGSNPEKLTKSEATGFAQFLEKLGFGVEPDPRVSSSLPSLKSHLALFRSPPEATQNPIELEAEYFTATLVAQMALATASGDQMPSQLEQQYLEAHINSVVDLDTAERSRFVAHIHWLLQDKPTLKSLKSRLERLEPAQRAEIAPFLVHVAAADGQITPPEIKILEKAYTLLDRDPQLLYSDIHDRNTTPSKLRSGRDPVTVRAAVSTEGHKIPPPPKRPRKDALTLDMELVQSKLAESQEVSSLLAEIFVEEEPVQPAKAPRKTSKKTSSAAGQKSARQKSAKAVKTLDVQLVAGLDAAHSGLLQAIAQKPEWQRSELEAIAARLSLMLDGALEVINEAAFDRCDEAVIEGDDPLEVNPIVVQELLA